MKTTLSFGSKSLGVLISVAMVVAGLTSNVVADVVLIDFSAAATPDNPDLNGNQWNTIGNNDLTSLFDSGGNSTNWFIQVTGTNQSGSGFSGVGVDGPIGPAPFNDPSANRPTVDGLFSNRGDDGTATTGLVTITVTNLDPNLPHLFSMIGGRATNFSDGIITLTVGSGEVEGMILSDGTLLNRVWTPDVDGTIQFTFFDSNGENTLVAAGLNAMSITAIPEPSSLLVLGLGFAGLTIRRRRH